MCCSLYRHTKNCINLRPNLASIELLVKCFLNWHLAVRHTCMHSPRHNAPPIIIPLKNKILTFPVSFIRLDNFSPVSQHVINFLLVPEPGPMHTFYF